MVVAFFLAGALTLHANEHVRVDIFYARLAPRYRSLIDILAMLVFVIPTCGLLDYFGWLDVQQARSFPHSIDSYRPLLWFKTQEAWAGSSLYQLETIILEFLLKGEASANPGGLPARWVIKAMLPLSACTLLLEAGRLLWVNLQIFTKKVSS